MFQEKTFFVYIMTNTNNTVIYVGFSGQVNERINQHKKKYSKGFTNR
ncbi:MAG: GIY-YIG nuclease family protein, partial [Gelidibacter sp.]